MAAPHLWPLAAEGSCSSTLDPADSLELKPLWELPWGPQELFPLSSTQHSPHCDLKPGQPLAGPPTKSPGGVAEMPFQPGPSEESHILKAQTRGIHLWANPPSSAATRMGQHFVWPPVSILSPQAAKSQLMCSVSNATLVGPGSAWCPKPLGAQAHALPGPHTGRGPCSQGLSHAPRPQRCITA